MESVSFPEESKSSAENPPVGWTELVVVAVAVALCDLTIFRGRGYTGYAALVVGLPLLLAFGSPSRRWNQGVLFTAELLIGVAVRLAWCGSVGAVFAGAVCLIAYAMSDQHETQRHWTARQVAREKLRQGLASIPEVPALSPQAIDDRIEAYRKYAYQWY